MGNIVSEVQPTGRGKHATPQVPKGEIIFDKCSSAIFNRESTAEKFIGRDLYIPRDSRSVHTPDMLVDILVGCYDQLTNVPEITEAIVETQYHQSTRDRSGLLGRIENAFAGYKLLEKIRENVYFAKSVVNKTVSRLDAKLERSEYLCHIKFHNVATFLDRFLDDNLRKESEDVRELFHYLVAYNPVCAFSYPEDTSPFLTKDRLIGNSELFTCVTNFRFGVTSNGNFVFVISEMRTLQISAVCGGGLSPMMVKKLPFEVTKDVSLVASQTELWIFVGSSKYTVLISDLLKPDKPQYVESKVGDNYMCYISDGVTYCKITEAFDVTIYRFDEKETKRSLTLSVPGFEKARKGKDAKVPPGVAETSIEMCGSFLNVVSKGNEQGSSVATYSLLTGSLVKEYVVSALVETNAVAYDSRNSCHWIIGHADGSRKFIRRIASNGCVNPALLGMFEEYIPPSKEKKKGGFKWDIITKTLPRMLNMHMMHYVGSKVMPKWEATADQDPFTNCMELCDYLRKALQYPFKKKIELRNCILQTIVVLMSHQMRLCCHESERYADCLSEFLARVDSLHEAKMDNLAVLLFFGAIPFIQSPDIDITKKISLTIVELFTSIQDENIAQYALRQLEPCPGLLQYVQYILEEIRKDGAGKLMKLLPVLMVHQRVMFVEACEYLKKNPYVEQFNTDKPSNPVEFLLHYMTFITSTMSGVTNIAMTLTDIEEHPIMQLFWNAIRLTSSLVTFHAFAHRCVAMLQLLLSILSAFLQSNRLSEDSTLMNTLSFAIYIYGKLACTGISGNFTDVEKTFYWLINAKNKIEGIEKDIVSGSLDVVDAKYRAFYGDVNGLKNFYNKNRRLTFGRDLSNELGEIDRLVIMVFAKHMGFESVLHNYNGKDPIPANVNAALTAMKDIRTQYQVLSQASGDEANIKKMNNIRAHCVMLLQVNSVLPEDPAQSVRHLKEFILCPQVPEEIVQIMKLQQKQKFAVVFTSFDIMKLTLSTPLTPGLFNVLINAMTEVNDFLTLKCILGNMSRDEVERHGKIVGDFFSALFKLYLTQNNDGLMLFAYRFFRDAKDFMPMIRYRFLVNLIKIFGKNEMNDSIFALIILLMPSITANGIPSGSEQSRVPLEFLKSGPRTALLYALALRYIPVKCNEFRDYMRMFLENINDHANIRFKARVLFSMMALVGSDATSDPNDVSVEMMCIEIQRLLEYIGDGYDRMVNLASISEIIYILRLILVGIDGNDNLPCKKILLDYMRSVKSEEDNDLVLCGIFAVLGGSLEPIRPFCNLIYQESRTESNDYLALPTDKPNYYRCYQRPFRLDQPEKIINVANGYGYAGSILPLSADSLTAEEYNPLDSFEYVFNPKTSAVVQALYTRMVACFAKFPDFVKSMTPEQISVMVQNILPFHNISETLVQLDQFRAVRHLPEVFGFSQLQYGDGDWVSYISPPISSSATIFNVELSFVSGPKNAYIGLVTNTTDGETTLYSVVHFPTGKCYPVSREESPGFTENQNPVSLIVNANHNVFSVGAVENLPFPDGVSWRVIIAVDRKSIVQIQSNMNAFDDTILPKPSNVCLFDSEEFDKVYEEKPLKINTYSEKELLQKRFTAPVDYIVIHPEFATHASTEIIRSVSYGIFSRLSLQWRTVVLIRILKHCPEYLIGKEFSNTLIPKLFEFLVVPLESFNTEKCQSAQFPFNLDEPVWETGAQTNHLFMNLQEEAKEALSIITSHPELVTCIGLAIERVAISREMHFIGRANKYVALYPSGNVPSSKHIRRDMIIMFGGSGEYCNDVAFSIKDRKGRLPGIITRQCLIEFNDEVRTKPLSVLRMSRTTNEWIFGTAFELILLLKNYIFAIKETKQRFLAKIAFLKSLICRSPMIIPYITEIMSFIDLRAPSSPFEQDEKYKDTIELIGKTLPGNTPFEKTEGGLTVKQMYEREHRFLSLPVSLDIACHFSEFFGFELPAARKDTITIPRVEIAGGSISDNFEDHIQLIRQSLVQHQSIVDFPFWDILPYWLRVSNFAASLPAVAGRAEPQVVTGKDDTMIVINPSAAPCKITFAFTGDPPATSFIAISDAESFVDHDLINDYRGEIILGPRSNKYFRLIDFPNKWRQVTLNVTPLPSEDDAGEGEVYTIEAATIKARFVDDMKNFATKWTTADTYTLMDNIPHDKLIAGTFDLVKEAVNSPSLTPLCITYGENVVLLRALFLYHFTYIREHHKDKVRDIIWQPVSNLISFKEASSVITKAVKCGEEVRVVVVDRHAAQQIVIDGGGNLSNIILAQLGRIFYNDHTPEEFRGKERPWKVKFVGEDAIDASGPTRELILEGVNSMFEPTSQLTINVPNGQEGRHGKHCDKFIPFTKAENRDAQYRAMGVLLGIIVRTGYCQMIPFAELVWKSLAGEKLQPADICDVDAELAKLFDNMRNWTPDMDGTYTWTVVHWDGTRVTLPNHTDAEFVTKNQVNDYISECIKYRINSLMPFLTCIREGLTRNIGFQTHPMLTGRNLSRMCQGSDTIDIDVMKSVMIYDHYEIGDDQIKWFWEIVEEMDQEHLQLLLKFITTSPRIPNTYVGNTFVLKIDPSGSAAGLPTASTCFNRLHWPKYTNKQTAKEKLLYAIVNCQSMELV